MLSNQHPSIPRESLQELLVNAYTHRCWRTAGPVMIVLGHEYIEVQNPGDLLPGLHVGNLIHCVPAYRNLLLAEGARFSGLSDKIGQGIDIVYKTVLAGGFDFPIFQSADNAFKARIVLTRSEEFREFVRRRASSLDKLDEIVVLRYLFAHGRASADELCGLLQRDRAVAGRVIAEMTRKLMIERDSEVEGSVCLSESMAKDIRDVFSSDQLLLFGGN